MDILNKEKIQILTNSFYKEIEVIETTTSTNDILKNTHPTSSPYVLISNSQTKGKGRNGRSFYSPVNSGIYMSIFLKPNLRLNDSLKISACISVAITRAIKYLYKIDTKIKWINDIYFQDKKLAGILCESSLKHNSDYLEYMIIGVGINVHKTTFPQELSNIATSIENNTDLINERNTLIALILNNFYELYKEIDTNTFLKEYKLNSYILNKEINIITPKETYSAIAIDIDDKAQLIIQKGYKTVTLSSGEISIRKK